MVSYKVLQKRIERDKERKQANREKIGRVYDRLENVFTPRNFIQAYWKCRRGTSYKLSVQRYGKKPLSKILPAMRKARAGIVPPISSSKKVVIRERGKERIITPIRIADRVVQRVLCDNALVPMVERRLIYDNGASRKGKGIAFARRRFNIMLERAKAKWGNDFYCLTFDFKNFFASVPHALCYDELKKVFADMQLVDVCMQVIESYQMRDARMAGDMEEMVRLKRHEGIGICLGSQVSQVMALSAPNRIDHLMKDVLGIHEMIRYMDDGVMLHQDREFLVRVLEALREAVKKAGLRLNEKKTRISHIRHGLSFMKVRYHLRGMTTVKRIAKTGIVRMRRRLRKLGEKVRLRLVDMDSVYNSVQSWASHAKCGMSWRTRRNILIEYERMYGEYDGFRRVCL